MTSYCGGGYGGPKSLVDCLLVFLEHVSLEKFPLRDLNHLEIPPPGEKWLGMDVGVSRLSRLSYVAEQGVPRSPLFLLNIF